MKIKWWLLILGIIVLLGLGLRVYQLTQIPPSISWDEAAVGYNAFTLANWGRDEWGQRFPLVFKSFEDYKHPVHIYLTAIFVKVLGSSDVSLRLPAALFGVGNILMIFWLGKLIFQSQTVGLIAALILTLSPYNLQFSRFNHELNFTLFFFMLGLALFLAAVKKSGWLLPWAFLAFGISLLSYHSAKVVVIPLLLLLATLYLNEVTKYKTYFYSGLVIFTFFILLLFLNPNLLGLARLKQTAFSAKEVKTTWMYQQTKNLLAGRAEITAKQYLQHFSAKYLYLSGDANARHSTQVVGEFYRLDVVLLIVGLAILLWSIIIGKNKVGLFLLGWALMAPLPSAAVNEAPHAARAMFMTGSWHLIIAYGFYNLLRIFERKYLKTLIIIFALAIYGFEVVPYLRYYFVQYPKRYGIDWQFGMKEAVKASEQEGLYSVFITSARSQPYIFFLYYLKYPLPELIKTVQYNNDIASRSFSLVRSFGKYQFTDWDPIEAVPNDTCLYLLTPSEYSGLRNKGGFMQAEAVLLPNSLDAFYLVSGKKILESEEP